MLKYYVNKLSGRRLERVYEIADERVKQYLDAEADYACEKVKQGNLVLDLGCGYGRIIPKLLDKRTRVIGIDNSMDNLIYGKQYLKRYINWNLVGMDAGRLGFADNVFDVVICVQNGISAFKVEPNVLLEESLRVLKPGGTALFSTYSQKFWKHRLNWFRQQAAEGLLGEIDDDRTGNGTIVCKDGFKAITFSAEKLTGFTASMDCKAHIMEVDESSVFLELAKNQTNKQLMINDTTRVR